MSPSLLQYGRRALTACAAMVALLGSTAQATGLSVTLTPLLAEVAAGPVMLPSGVVVPAGTTIALASIGRPGLDTFVTYDVRIANTTSKHMAYVRLGLAPSVFESPATVPAPVATFAEANGAPCTADLTLTSVKCVLGRLSPAGQPGSERSFQVTFKAPAQGAQLDLNWTAFYRQGNTIEEARLGIPRTISSTSYCRLITLTPSEISSSLSTSVPSFGGTFYTGGAAAGPAVPSTGIGSAPTAADPTTTTVVVPSGITPTTAEISEIDAPVFPCLPGSCFESQLRLPGTFDALTIFLRRDATTVIPGTTGRDVVVYYVADAGPNAGVPIELQRCAKRSPPGPAPYEPCINAVRRYNKVTSPGPEWLLDKEIEIKALDNGRYIN